MSVWREPSAQTEDYPGLVVHDGRVSGSITLGRSRLPMWAFIGRLAQDGFEDATRDWDDLYGWDAEKMDELLYNLFEVRGEFARLLLMLADAERCDRTRPFGTPWWETKRHRKRVSDQLRRCLAALEAEAFGE